MYITIEISFALLKATIHPVDIPLLLQSPRASISFDFGQISLQELNSNKSGKAGF